MIESSPTRVHLLTHPPEQSEHVVHTCRVIGREKEKHIQLWPLPCTYVCTCACGEAMFCFCFRYVCCLFLFFFFHFFPFFFSSSPPCSSVVPLALPLCLHWSYALTHYSGEACCRCRVHVKASQSARDGRMEGRPDGCDGWKKTCGGILEDCMCLLAGYHGPS